MFQLMAVNLNGFIDSNKEVNPKDLLTLLKRSTTGLKDNFARWSYEVLASGKNSPIAQLKRSTKSYRTSWAHAINASLPLDQIGMLESHHIAQQTTQMDVSVLVVSTQTDC